MAIRVGLRLNFKDTLILADLENLRSGAKNLCRNSYTCQVIADLVLKFPNFRYHGNKGWSRVNLNDTVILYDIENPTFRGRLSAISHTNRVMANFVLKFPNIRYHGNNGRSGVNFNDAVKLHDLENPLFGA